MKKITSKNYKSNSEVFLIEGEEHTESMSINFDGVGFASMGELEEYIKEEIIAEFGDNIDNLDEEVLNISINYQHRIEE